ncbi:WXG100 family type VII secretion target [Streptomyces sp. PTM05]|uniref:WXG100 family type VII secretion target n=1 Tax=Streptantibioticus parmotrematis TaxID=2873249 RepID=A0ABS7QW89_9ACTN|nr:WXG100 family type VII secretion target [Streptantibioticus parmotrematis]MBY8886966.1 WXG100 family type VII secretion target [Streptantibioticus parmotrematis]
MADGLANFKVTPEMISTAATSCDTTAADVDSKLGELKTYVTNLENVWQGIAQNTFQEMMVEYQTYAQMLHNALTDIAQGLRGNYVNYTDSENANLTTIHNVQSQLSAANLG